ncbi:hypothetical protein HSBAA_17010 [Vreelandella sulfidaeris]|uniref:RNase II/RNase R cold shock domain-containing protein n=1 Tax=Vreelandella sulfidaeris TaxID=115553 RepID=A0A455U3F9_9GAMM|nr:hypothetical protein HSBAA_17010 [Halomonas sulfidaeris]
MARVQKREGRLAVVPDHPSIKNVIKARIKNNLDEESIADGDWVVARLVRHPLKADDRAFFAQIDELVAKSDDPAVPWRVTLARHALEQECPDAGTDWPLLDEGLTREDLTATPFFTIDGEDPRYGRCPAHRTSRGRRLAPERGHCRPYRLRSRRPRR